MTSILSNEKVYEKYIRVCEGSIRVKLERGETILIGHFKIRHYNSFADALQAAIKWRDEKHLELFGMEVPKNVIHIAPRKNRRQHVNPETGELLPYLMPGISYGFHKGLLRYVVVSHQENDKPVRTRYSIKLLGLDEAIKQATDKRKSMMPNA